MFYPQVCMIFISLFFLLDKDPFVAIWFSSDLNRIFINEFDKMRVSVTFEINSNNKFSGNNNLVQILRPFDLPKQIRFYRDGCTEKEGLLIVDYPVLPYAPKFSSLVHFLVINCGSYRSESLSLSLGIIVILRLWSAESTGIGILRPLTVVVVGISWVVIWVCCLRVLAIDQTVASSERIILFLMRTPKGEKLKFTEQTVLQ